MGKNRAKEYFKYALGEIVLVMIGILLALQVSNFNERLNDEEKLESYILEFKDELKLNISLFDREIKAAENYIKRNIRTLQVRDFEEIDVDSLEMMIETFYVNFETENFVHESFKNSQITEYGKYDSVINEMQIYYTWHYAEIASVLKQNNTAVDKSDDFWRFEQNSYELSYGNEEGTSLQSESVRKRQIITLLRSPRARNILKLDIRKKKEVISWLKSWRDLSIKNIELINRTLELSDES